MRLNSLVLTECFFNDGRDDGEKGVAVGVHSWVNVDLNEPHLQ